MVAPHDTGKGPDPSTTKDWYMNSYKPDMSSTLSDRPIHLAMVGTAPTPRKRNSSHLALNSTSKRFKAANSLDTSSPPLLSSVVRGDPAGRFRAEEWFKNTDKNASRDVSFLDNDPPFYINHRSSSDGSSVCAVQSDGTSFKRSTLGKPTAPTRALLAKMESSESNSEGFRGVIDDLTIQNKKLKKKLRQYEELHCSHLQDDKMFEVRIHGLPAHRKRELEETLRSFATSIEESSPNGPSIPIEPALASSGPFTGLQKAAVGAIPTTKSLSALGKPSSTSTSNSKPIDSAYASMSGQTGTSQLLSHDIGSSKPLDSAYASISGKTGISQRDKWQPEKGIRDSQAHQNVNSYLHDIPETLVPKHSMAMSDRSKSILVVERLEQIFTGKGAASRHHSQSYQQQEISNSAARADRIGLEAPGRGRQPANEGFRQARISDDTELKVDFLSEANIAVQQSRQSSNDGRASTQATQPSRESSPDQRPTRPLDLDLHRAQIPEENIDYIRHLRSSSPKDGTDLDTDDGWIFLNLLISMAQLHTLNVTPGFIKNAIAKISSHIELSADKTKARWLGGSEGTRLSSDSDESSDMEMGKSTEPSLSVNKPGLSTNLSSNIEAIDRQEPNTALPGRAYGSSADQELGNKRVPVFFAKANNGANFHYKPLFFHGEPSEQGDDSTWGIDSAIPSDSIENANGMHSGMHSGINSGSHGLRETEVKLRKQNAETGPIIFYHKARFCTDLSGDPSGGVIDETAYRRYCQDPVGCSPENFDDPEVETLNGAAYPLEIDYDSTSASGLALDLDDLKSCIADGLGSTSSTNSAPVPLEVSGIGSVNPDDSFVVRVQVRHHQTRKGISFSPRGQTVRAQYRLFQQSVESIPRTIDMPRSHPIQIPVHSEIISMITTHLEPSTLPSPVHLEPFSSSGSEDDESVGGEATKANHSKSRSPRDDIPATFPLKSPSEEDIESSYASASAGSDDDSSIDLLAHARELDPDAVAAREREFDISLLPATSVAATNGKSSPGFYRPMQQVESDIDSMSVDDDNMSRMDDSD